MLIPDERTGAEAAPRRPTTARRRFVAACVVAVALAGPLALAPTPAGSIVGGDFARIDGHPHQVALVTPNGGQFCGGSIIGASTVVTAAHCVERTTPRGVRVQAGSAHLYRGRAQIRSVDRIARHPRYARQDVADIAILHLSRPLRFGRKVQPIEPATPAELAAATHAVATGWGARFEENRRGSARLRRVRVPIVDDRSCNDTLRDRGASILPRLELCAGAPGLDSCYGDSGGPLVITTPDGVRLAGITSWGLAPCAGPTPGVYTEVPPLRSWIRRHDIG
jgi:trypsin